MKENFQGIANLDILVHVVILEHSFKKENRGLMAKVNLCQTKLSYASERYTT